MSPPISHRKGMFIIRHKFLWFLLIIFISSILTACSEDEIKVNENVDSKPTDTEKAQTTVPLPNPDEETAFTPINYDIVKQTISEEHIITEKEIGLDSNKHLEGIFQSGDIIYTSDESCFYRYEADYNHKIYTMTDTIPLSASKDVVKVGISDDGNIVSGLDMITYDQSTSFLPEIVNAQNNIAYIQVNAQDGSCHTNYYIDLDTREASEVNTDNVVNALMTDEQKKKSIWVTLISLPNRNTLYHIFVQDKYADNMTSYWAVCDKEETIQSSFQTRYFDNLSNVHIDSSGRYVIFSYSQTPGYPQLLDTEKERVYPLFQEESVLKHQAVTFLSWVNPEQICVGFADADRTVAIVSVADVINNTDTQ